MRKIWHMGAAGTLALLAAACGKIGNPLPPSLHLPQPVKDLRAARKANRVALTWSEPRETTDNESAIKHLGPARVCRAIGPANESMKRCEQAVGTIAPQIPPKDATGPVTLTFSEELPADLMAEHPNDFAIYAVESQNSEGRADGLSNQIAVPLAPTLPPPSELKAELKDDGVHITANAPSSLPAAENAQYSYRLYRTAVPAPPKTTPVAVAEASAAAQPALTDTSMEWEKTYSYFITPVTKLASTEIEGADSEPVQVFAHDVYPPAVPTGLQAVFSGSAQQNFIDLTWTPDSDADLAGYNVYRHEQGAEAVRINTAAVKTPAFRDSNVEPGHSYFYSVSAFDQRNNESARSTETSETVPAAPTQ